MSDKKPDEMQKRGFFLRSIGPVIFSVFAIYICHQLFRFAQLPPLITLFGVAWVCFIIYSILFIILTFWLNPKKRESKKALLAQKLGSFAQGYVSYLLSCVLFRDIVSFFGYLFSKELFSYDQNEALLFLLLPPVLMVLGRVVVFLGPFTKKVKVYHRGLPAGIEGLRIVQLSDLHIGPGISREKIRGIVEQVNRLEADVIALTGDIVDHSDESFNGHIHELKSLKAKHGVFYSPGNHEYYWGFQGIIEKIRQLDFHILLNSNRILEIDGATLAICGVPDIAANYFSMEPPSFEKAIAGADHADFKIVLSHQPNTADQARKHKFNLQLSGHTHGGQFIPWSLIIRLFQKYPKGLIKLGHLQLYVNRGTGYWGPPDRLGSYSEISCITLLNH